MPSWISDLLGGVTLVDAILWVILISIIIGLIIKAWPFVRGLVAFVGIVPILLKLSDFIDDTTKTLEDHTETLSRQDVQIAAIHHETHKNDGSSIKDAMERVEVGVAGLYGEIDKVNITLQDLQSEDRRLQREIDERTQPTLDIEGEDE